MEEKIEMETKKDRIDNIGLIAELEFDTLLAYAHRTYELYDSWEKQMMEDYRKAIKSAADREGYIRSIFRRELDAKDNMHSLLFNTAFVSCVGTFEYFLRDICNILTIKG